MSKVASGIFFTKLLSCLCPGEYVALSGARLDGAEMLACGLATHFVQSNVGSLVTSILTVSITNTLSINSLNNNWSP
jgi:3-hydroxyisobutyryl-CoA hydrolase